MITMIFFRLIRVRKDQRAVVVNPKTTMKIFFHVNHRDLQKQQRKAVIPMTLSVPITKEKAEVIVNELNDRETDADATGKQFFFGAINNNEIPQPPAAARLSSLDDSDDQINAASC